MRDAPYSLDGFRGHLSPPAAAAAAPYPPSKCDAQKCPWWPYSNSKDFKANTALVVVILVCALICGLAFNSAVRYVIRLRCRRRRRRREAEDAKAELDGGGGDEEAGISVVAYAEGMELAGEVADCIICLSEFVTGEKIRVLEDCKHGFHVKCIQKWLISHSSCPTCRTSCSVKSSTPI